MTRKNVVTPPLLRYKHMTKEVEILNRFIIRGLLKGWFIGEVPVGVSKIGEEERRARSIP
jgi:hypothetical protein